MTKRWYEIPGICLLMLALSLVSTYPLVLYFDSGIPYGSYGMDITWDRSGDQMQLLYWFWLVKENLLGNVPFDTNPFEFNTGVSVETTGFHTFPLALLYVLFSPLGDVAAYNCTIIATYLLTGTYIYLLILLYSGSKAGALLGAMIFTFAPSRINGITGGNAYGMLFFLYPWILYYLEKGIRQQKVIYGVLSGIGLLCLSMLESHLLYYICLFLAGYLPLRIIAEIPACHLYMGKFGYESGIFTRSSIRCLLLQWIIGIGMVLYSQALFSGRDHDPFISQYFWWIVGLYPIVFVLLGICFALIYQRLSPLDFSESFALETKSLVPLLLFYPLAVVPYIDDTIDTTIVIISAIAVAVTAKLFVLRKQLPHMLETLFTGVRDGHKSVIWPIVPVVAAMAYIALWLPMAKVGTLSSTIAAKGRTLHDVKLYTAHVNELFISTSNVYIGIVTAIFLALFFLMIVWYCISEKRSNTSSNSSDLMLFFFALVGLCGFILSLGLAFGKSSLYLLLYQYLPYFNYPRVSDRIIVLALFAMAITVGFLVRRMQQRLSGIPLKALSAVVLAAAVLQLIDFNLHRPIGVTILNRGQDIYTYVQENIDDGLLLEIPLWPGDSHQSSLYQRLIMLDEVPRVNGYSPLVRSDYIENVFKPLSSLNKGKLNKQQYESLTEMGVKYVTVHNNEDVFTRKVSPYGPLTTVRRLRNSPYLEFVDMENTMYYKTHDWEYYNLYLFRVKDKSEINIQGKHPIWYEMPDIYTATHRLYRQAGEIVEDERTGRKIFLAQEGKNDPGILVYGPYTHFSAGDYRCYFHIKAVSAKGQNVKIARIEVLRHTTDGEQVVLAESELSAGTEGNDYTRIPLDFSLKNYAKLEFRVLYYGHGDLSVEQVSVYARGHETPLDVLEAEKMVGETGLIAAEPEARGGQVVEGLVKVSKNGDMVYGPSRVYPEGRYRASYLIRMLKTKDLKKSTPAAVIYVTDEHNVRFFAERKVRAEHLQKNEFKKISVEFETATEEELSFHLRFRDKVNLQLDRIEVEKLE